MRRRIAVCLVLAGALVFAGGFLTAAAASAALREGLAALGKPGDIYTIGGTRTASGQGNVPTAAPLNQPAGVSVVDGNVYIADTADNRVEEVPARTGVQWGIAMKAGHIYTIAGSATGVAGRAGDRGPSASSLLNHPQSVAVDASGDVYIADAGNSRVQMIAAGATTPFVSTTIAGDVYTIAGSLFGKSGRSQDGRDATSALLHEPTGVTVGPTNNSLYIADLGNNRVEELAAADGTQWGVPMLAGHLYTIAGSAAGKVGYSGDSGAARSARLNFPSAVAVSSSGNLYIADFGNNRVQEVCAATGACGARDDIYTVAGSATGRAGFVGDGGLATASMLNGPWSLRLDWGTDLYIADLYNNRVQEVADSSHVQWHISMRAGHVYTIAGSASGQPGGSGYGGAARLALLNGPASVALDGSFNLYIADSFNNRVREVSAKTSDISLYAGSGETLVDNGDSGAALASGLDNPDGVATDAEGNVYVADTGDNRVQEIAATDHTQWGVSMAAGDVYTVAGSAVGSFGDSGDGNAAAQSLLDIPIGLAVDVSGDLYIADTDNNRIQEVAARSGRQWGIRMTASHVYTVAGNVAGTAGDAGDHGPATSALLSQPWGVTVDGAGDLYIADTNNNQIREIPKSTGWHRGVFMKAGDIYTVAGSTFGTAGDLGDGWRATLGLLAFPTSVVIDRSGNLYIADAANNRIQEIAVSMGLQWAQQMDANTMYTVAGNAAGSLGFSGDSGPASAALLDDPIGLAMDSAGDLYFSDSFNNRIQEIAATRHTQWDISLTPGDIYTIAGSASGDPGFSGDGGPATSALLNTPFGVAIDPAGDVYLTDEVHHCVREVVANP